MDKEAAYALHDSESRTNFWSCKLDREICDFVRMFLAAVSSAGMALVWYRRGDIIGEPFGVLRSRSAFRAWSRILVDQDTRRLNNKALGRELERRIGSNMSSVLSIA